MSWEKNVRKVVPYVPGEQPKMNKIIKLNTNENPYPPAPGVQEAMKALTKTFGTLRLYPSPTCDMLIDALSEYYGIDKDKIFVGVGSDDVLDTAFLTFFDFKDKQSGNLLFPDITYSFYDVWASLYRIPYETVPVNDDLTINYRDFCKGNAGGIVIANPNAPTGIELPVKGAIEEIIKSNPDCVVIVDEAYADFGDETALSLIDRYDNLLVVRTYSKSRSMAGMRIGMAFGNPKLIKYMNDVKFSVNSYTMNIPALCYGVASLHDEEYFRTTVGKIVATRERSKEKFRKLGFSVTDSKTNFLFVSHPLKPATEIFAALRERGIIVRHFNNKRIDNYLRITIGTDAEMDELFAALEEIL
ncbi:MAG: histidinol-phosphate transaminase [Lachnospiraceae bacterium]|nr:histidinol-phosphate transaminase [Lachnospiraceae bacterium]